MGKFRLPSPLPLRIKSHLSALEHQTFIYVIDNMIQSFINCTLSHSHWTNYHLILCVKTPAPLAHRRGALKLVLSSFTRSFVRSFSITKFVSFFFFPISHSPVNQLGNLSHGSHFFLLLLISRANWSCSIHFQSGKTATLPTVAALVFSSLSISL